MCARRCFLVILSISKKMLLEMRSESNAVLKCFIPPVLWKIVVIAGSRRVAFLVIAGSRNPNVHRLTKLFSQQEVRLFFFK